MLANKYTSNSNNHQGKEGSSKCQREKCYPNAGIVFGSSFPASAREGSFKPHDMVSKKRSRSKEGLKVRIYLARFLDLRWRKIIDCCF